MLLISGIERSREVSINHAQNACDDFRGSRYELQQL